MEAHPILLAVPNVSEGRTGTVVATIASAHALDGSTSTRSHPEGGRADALAGAVRLLDVHSDADHHRSVLTIAGPPAELTEALLACARAAIEHIDVVSRASAGPGHAGQHPHVGALDVVPVVYLRQSDRGAACAAALVVADRLGQELELPVFLYGELTADGSGRGRTRAELRRGGVAGLARRIAGEERLLPDFGPARMHPTAGAALVAARSPLVAFNLTLAAPASVVDARAIAARIREGGEQGLPGLRAIGIELVGGVAQVSMNVERPLEVPLARIVEAVRSERPVEGGELVGLAPAAALEGFPEDVPLPGFDPARHIIENALGC
jgi:glutamate formiminotransferase